jgi:hypothetical protein
MMKFKFLLLIYMIMLDSWLIKTKLPINIAGARQIFHKNFSFFHFLGKFSFIKIKQKFFFLKNFMIVKYNIIR